MNVAGAFDDCFDQSKTGVRLYLLVENTVTWIKETLRTNKSLTQSFSLATDNCAFLSKGRLLYRLN